MRPIGPFVLCSFGGVATPGLLSAAVLRRLAVRVDVNWSGKPVKTEVTKAS